MYLTICVSVTLVIVQERKQCGFFFYACYLFCYELFYGLFRQVKTVGSNNKCHGDFAGHVIFLPVNSVMSYVIYIIVLSENTAN